MKTLIRHCGLLALSLVLAASARAITSVSLSTPASAETSSTYYVSASGSDDMGEILSLTVTRNGQYWASAYSQPYDYTRYAISLGGNDTAPSSTGSVSFYAQLDTDSWWTSDSKSVTITAETTPPSQPNGLSGSSVTMSSFTLSWNASTDNVGVTAYEVKRDSTSLGETGSTSMSITGLSMNTTYTMTVRAKDAAGNWSSWSSGQNVTTAGDTSAPSVPSGLSGGTPGLTSFTLSWSASSDNVGVAAYEVKRDATSLGETGSTSLGVSGLAPNTTYAMSVRARDAANNWSSWSSPTNVTTAADTTAPSVPAGLSGGTPGLTSFTLTWSASSDNVGVAAYEVKRGTDSLGEVGTTSKSVTGLTPNTTYAMSVRARDAANNWSSWSTAQNVTTAADTTAPSVPGGLAASNVTVNSFTLSWSASTDNIAVTEYEVMRDTTSLGNVSVTSKSVTGLTASTTYAMKVRARDAAGNWSSWSSVLNVTATNLTADDDSDGLTNGEELLMGTNPNSAATAASQSLEVHRP